jgi:small subunit ribosomal protein S17
VSTEEPVTGEVTDESQDVSTPDAAGEGAAAPAVPNEEIASERRGSSSKRAARKVREGVVVSDGMDKTAVVAVIERVRHPKYNKTVLQTKKLHAHDETNDVKVGDRVRVMETRPLSKHKRWRVVEVLERAR